MDGIFKYCDIINLPHHVSSKHPRMPKEARAAQFAAFSALSGYDGMVKETSRFTNKKINIDEDKKEELDEKLKIIRKNILDRPVVTITYFIPDLKKEGGEYVKVTNCVEAINTYEKTIILQDNKKINILEIIDITGELLDGKILRLKK